MTLKIRERFAFTVIANVVRAGLSFATALLLARWLGPENYGRMAFLLGTFLALRQLLDMGSSSAFFTFMSQKLRSRRFFRGFCQWLVVQFAIPVLFVALVFPSSWIEGIWQGESRTLIVLAFAAAFMQNTLWPVFQQAGESQRRTIQVQAAGVAVMAGHLCVVVALWFFGKLSLGLIFLAVIVEFALATFVVRSYLTFERHDTLEEPGLRGYLRYCLPLIPYTWVGFAYEFADRWLLQEFGGSLEQGYYAVSAQIAAISLIATTSILNILWKEVAEAHYCGDVLRAATLYRRVSRALLLFAAAIAGFLLPWAEQLLNGLLGVAYAGGAATLAVMFFYPIHQSIGQINGTMLYATERVALQVRIGIVFMLLSIVLTYFILAPPTIAVPGLGAGSLGLAAKMVILQFVQANITAWAVARQLGWRFDFVHQFVALLLCVTLGWVAHTLAMAVSPASMHFVIKMTIAGVIYAGTLGACLCTSPWLLGMIRTDLKSPTQWLKHS